MLIFKHASDLTEYLSTIKGTIGYVPTMGALHEGHIALINASEKDCDLTVCSIFVNPTQFNNPEDLALYPRPIDNDIQLLTNNNCDVLYIPDVPDIYPDGISLNKKYDLGKAASILEGAFRPGHFAGVVQVVDRFLDIIRPHTIFLGQKDLQQVAVISNLLKQHHPQVQVVVVPTVRDDDGLAKSSRNKRLNIAERARAPFIYQCLVSIQSKNGMSPFPVVEKECRELLGEKGFRVEYIALIDMDSFELLEDYDNGRKMAALIAAFNGNIRLIDNILL